MSSGKCVCDATRVRAWTGGDMGFEEVRVGEAGRGAVGGFLSGCVRRGLTSLLLLYGGRFLLAVGDRKDGRRPDDRLVVLLRCSARGEGAARSRLRKLLDATDCVGYSERSSSMKESSASDEGSSDSGRLL